MVIILPTFGFTSAQAYIDFLIKNNQLNWECIFLPDSGAFFVNYVITSAMIGSGLELIRCVLNPFGWITCFKTGFQSSSGISSRFAFLVAKRTLLASEKPSGATDKN